ncbi:hypothetical protein [Brevundimonas sp. GCM10030266]|uniref:hypothetical protein n=1 Tax=Brevundimonas sp. GCM10030266 TaxID=3273386 RepID=UPI003605AFE9
MDFELSREQRIWLKMTEVALLEIRALEDANLPRARDLANIFHGVPNALFLAPDAWEAHKKALFGRAKAAGLEDFIRRNLEHFTRTVE